MSSQESPINILLNLLDLESIDDNIYRGQSRDVGGKSIFGGQVLAQALMAATRTVEPARIPHSLHGYFLRPGDTKSPVIYDVDRIRDGTSFTTRRVVAIQHGRPIFNMAASFQIEEEGFEHQAEMPQGVPPPEELTPELELRKRIADKLPEKVRSKFLQPMPVEFRHVNPINPFAPEKRPPLKYSWFRADGAMPDDIRMNQAVLAYASDFAFVGTSMLPHRLTFMQRNLQVASLDHAIWFHRKFRADEWLLYVQDSPSASNARGFNRGQIFTREGVLVASVAQEGLIRLRLEV